MKKMMGIYILSLTLMAGTNGCSVSKIDSDAAGKDRLAGCPDRPNCVSSETRAPGRAIAPLRLKSNQAATWSAIRELVERLPRCTIVKATDRYLHAECRSRLFGFIDDLELQFDQSTGSVAIRSASRVGYWDLGVNRKRLEALHRELKQKELVY